MSHMEKLGLNGKSILPFISGFGCNIASVAGCRVIDSEEQRKVTIAASLAIPCPGIWGVVALLSGIFFKGAAPLIAGALFVASILHIMFTAWFFRDKSIRKQEMPGLIMELPPFHMPNWKTIFGSAIYSPITYDAASLSTAIGSTVSKASALAFIFAFYFNIPCFGTIAAIRSETGSTGYTLKLSAYYIITALIIAGIVYRIGLLIF